MYLAGPDVFLPDPAARADRLKAICAAHGLLGVFPLDPPDAPAAPALPPWQRIALANEAHIRGSDALIANLTPFRGPSADPGTVFEVGFARALGRPVFGWSAVGTTLRDRCGGGGTDAEGLTVEDFGLPENLMVPAAITGSGGCFLTPPIAGPAPDPWRDLSLFEACVRAAATLLAAQA